MSQPVRNRGTELRPGDPETVGGYRLLRRLGEGGMGAVFLGRGPDGRLVAVKVVRPELAGDEAFAARFRSEVANARRVASFCTAVVLDHGQDGERAFMVTEYIDGDSLLDHVTANGPLDPAMLHGVAVGVAAALVAIHGSGLIHRDLKPANVLLSLSGPRVIDFGIARALDAATSLTATGHFVGSPGWMAPEQIRQAPVTTAADVFAWGCLVAYASLGRHPYGSGDFALLAARMSQGEADLGPLPAPLDRLVPKALSLDPADRPTAQDLLLDLVGGTADDRSVRTTLTHTWTPTPSEGGRRRRPALVAGAVAVCVAAAVVAALLLTVRHTPHHPTAERTSHRAVTVPVTTGGDLVVRLDPPGAAGTCTSVLARLVRQTATLTRLDKPGGCDVLPEVSPDHAKIAFTRNNGTAGHAELWIMNADGSGARRVSDQIIDGTRSAWSPDGRTLAFAGAVGATSQLFTVSLTPGSRPKQLTEAQGGAASPSWSSTGRLAFVSGGQIYTASPANPTVWTPLTASSTRVTEPVWSRDGRKIVFVSGRQGSTDLWIMNADGTDQHPLTMGGHNDEDACWSPDGATIAFARGPGGGPRIWTVSPGGGEPREVTGGDTTEAQPSW